jgi:hypothetical protein
MSYRMHRVFCATPGDSESDLEPERQAFYDVIGEVNETEAMPEEILFVPVSVLPNLADLTVFRKPVDDNVRACAFYVQVLHHTWGPAARNFEHQYQLAKQCCADPQLPMKGVSLFFKVPNGRPVEPDVADLKESSAAAQDPRFIDFEDLDDFRTRLRSQLSAWLQSTKDF